MTNQPEHPAWRSPLQTIRDAISFACNVAPIRRATLAILDCLQFHPPSVQLDAVFVTGVVMARALGLDPHELVVRAKRVVPDADGPFSEQLATIGDYSKGELAS